MARKACERRRSFLKGLKTFAIFGKGWMERVAEVEAHAVALALAAAGLAPAAVAKTLDDYGSRNAAKAKTEAGKATGAGAVTTQPDLSGLDTSGLIVLSVSAPLPEPSIRRSSGRKCRQSLPRHRPSPRR
ncbi:hypothetical protein [Microvirga rosea]|uniref:hypothetical protein n=1 Tax=Microvirga rosea TaxID=2715425 RepID=UPI001D0B0A96|nr:hypothetical protein [Microvirga rosea]MCB8819963.1 hypothetical protein [Microvirga rosea]